MWDSWVIDGGMSDIDEDRYCVCPVELDENGDIENVVFGMNIITNKDGLDEHNVIAVIHEDGQEAANEFVAKMGGVASRTGEYQA